MKTNVFLSLESRPDYFLACFQSGHVTNYYELSDSIELDKNSINQIMSNYNIVCFNYNHQDLTLISLALSGGNTNSLNLLHTKLNSLNKDNNIKNILSQEGVNISQQWEYVDLESILGRLKKPLNIYNSRVCGKIIPTASMEMKDTCLVNIDTIKNIYNKLQPRIKVRKQLGAKIDKDIINSSDSKLAETYFRSLLGYAKQTFTSDFIKYKAPSNIRFNNQELVNLLTSLESTRYCLDKEGKVIRSDEQSKSITIDDVEYKVGLGGLHTTEKARVVETERSEFLVDIDVVSYYPKIILNNYYSPNALSDEFINMYSYLYEERARLLHEDDKVGSDSYKIILNSAFGKFGSPHSILYSPDQLIRTTFTGQLCLLMLIETLTAYGFKVISANTDGLVVKGNNTDKAKFKSILNVWELHHNFTLTSQEYSALYSESVNSYIALKVDGGVKLKGSYSEESLYKNPTSNVCKKAVLAYILHKTPIIDSIMNQDNLQTDFLNVSTVSNGVTHKGEYQGNIIRWYYAKHEDHIYSDNGHKVPNTQGASLLMDLSQPFEGLDLSRYVSKSYLMLERLGIQ